MTMFGSQWLANAGADYDIDQSIRFESGDDALLKRSLSSSGSLTTWTLSCWLKRGRPNANENSQWFPIWSASDGSSTSDYPLSISDGSTPGKWAIAIGGQNWTTSQRVGDVAAWYHAVVVWDSTNGTAGDRMRLYINGSRVTSFSATGTVSSSMSSRWNSSSYSHHRIGSLNISAGPDNKYLFDGYLAEMVFLDGTATTDASSFGEYDSNGVWIPKNVSGLTFGTNGFHITGADSTALGEDVRISGDQVVSYAASQYTGATGSYTYSNGRLEADTDNKAIRTSDTFTGDFEFSWRYINMANFVIGVYETGEDGTFNDSTSTAGMNSMTDSWYIQTSSVAANRDIFYGGAVQVNATTIADGDTWKMTRSSGTIKLIRNGSDVHTFSQTSTNTVRIAIAQGDAAADLGQVVWVDNSTLGNNFFSSGLAANDQMSDSPTNNWCTMNPLDAVGPTLSNGNLEFTDSNGSAWRTARATMAIPSTGKWYWECIATSSGGVGDPNFGIVADSVNTQVSDWYQDALAYAYSTRYDSVVNNNWTGTSRGTYAGGNVLQIAYDSGTGKLHFGIQNSWINGGDPADGSSPDFTTSTTLTFLPYVSIYNSKTGSINFGQSAFAYTPPTGFEALNTGNLPTPTIADGSKYFQTTLYEGDGSTQSIDQSGNSTFSPNLVWIKNRDATDAHALFDTVRGATKVLSSNSTAAEATNDDTLTAFESDGFAIGDDVIVNTNAESYAAWQWAEGATPGLDIIAYTGNGSNRTIAHNLGVKPGMFIVKARDRDDANWGVYHSAVGATKSLFLQSTGAAFDSDEYFNDTEPTSSVFTLGVNAQGNTDTKTYIAYVFAPVEGFSSFGSFTGNGNAAGPFVATGFKPAFIIFKVSTNAPTGWIMLDVKRDTFNAVNHVLQPNASDAENSGADFWDFVSNGFKVRNTWAAANGNGYTVTYMAFAEHPFGGDGVAPATAR